MVSHRPYPAPMHRRRILPALVSILLVVACGGDDVTPTTGSPPASSTTSPTTGPPTTGPPTTGGFVLDAPGIFPPPVLDGSGGANGSGCAPGGSAALPDGIWFGAVLANTAGDVTFDLACWFFGDVAVEEGEKDGVTVENGYHIRNTSPLTVTVPIHLDATMWYLSAGSEGFELVPIPMSEWPGPAQEWPCPGELCGVWLYVNDGVITGAYEQYRP